MVKKAGNETLKQSIRPIVRRIVGLWAFTLYRQKPVLFKRTIDEHAKIVRFFRERDAKGAEESTCAHVESLLWRALEASFFDQDGNFPDTKI